MGCVCVFFLVCIVFQQSVYLLLQIVRFGVTNPDSILVVHFVFSGWSTLEQNLKISLTKMKCALIFQPKIPEILFAPLRLKCVRSANKRRCKTKQQKYPQNNLQFSNENKYKGKKGINERTEYTHSHLQISVSAIRKWRDKCRKRMRIRTRTCL